MSQPPLGPYAASSALSAKHYKLVTAVESAPDDEAVNGVLVDACRRIRDSWAKTAPSPTKASHDLVLLLYCRTQRRDPSLAADEAALLEGEWALPTAVLLAGGGRLRERQLGYRACAELFPPTSHRLKLLLINTISHDLSVPPSDDDAKKRWSMALRAVGSPNIVSSELLSAVQEQIFDLLAARTDAESIKRLALATALSVVQYAKDEKLDDASALTAQTRARVLSLLLPPPASSASTSSRHTRSHNSLPSVVLLACLSSAIAPSSPIHPILPSAKDRIQLHALLLGRILDTLDLKNTSRSVWSVERALRSLAAELEGLDAADADAADAPLELVSRAVDGLLRTGTALAEGAIVSALERGADSLFTWLADLSADAALIDLLQEPLLFLLLRLVALNPSQTFPQVRTAISRAGPSFASPETQHLVTKLETVLRDAEARQALTKAGTTTADQSLADFSARLMPTPPTESSPSYADSHASSPAPSSQHSRLFHPPTVLTPSPAPSPALTTTTSPRAPRSARALERERADLLREREDRGGRGSGSRMVQSLMERESLRLEHNERGQGAEDERASSKNALGLQSLSSGVGWETGARGSQPDERETSGEPPSDLLIELKALDPFRRA